MLWILATNDIHISAFFPSHALAPIAQLLDAATHFHAPDLLVAAPCETERLEARREAGEDL